MLVFLINFVLIQKFSFAPSHKLESKSNLWATKFVLPEKRNFSLSFAVHVLYFYIHSNVFMRGERSRFLCSQHVLWPHFTNLYGSIKGAISTLVAAIDLSRSKLIIKGLLIQSKVLISIDQSLSFLVGSFRILCPIIFCCLVQLLYHSDSCCTHSVYFTYFV